jgi:hypothetical protein
LFIDIIDKQCPVQYEITRGSKVSIIFAMSPMVYHLAIKKEAILADT